MSAHTEEPWQVAKISGQDKWAVGPSATRRAGDAYTEVNARRIVACVNACKRFSTGLLEAAAACGGITEDPTAMLLQAEQQRDELLAALEKCSSQLNRLGYSANHADEAIAKVKGEQA